MPNAGIVASGVASQVWTPATLTGLKVWYDASNTGSITAAAGAVSQINDLSPNGYHAVQATAGNKPTTGAATQNGLNVLRHDGGDWMYMGSGKPEWKFLHDGTRVLVGAVWNPGAAGSRGLLGNHQAENLAGTTFYALSASNTLAANVSKVGGAGGVVNCGAASQIGFSAANVTTILLDPGNATAANRAYLARNALTPTNTNASTMTPSTTDPTRRLMIGALAGSDTFGSLPIANLGWWAEVIIVSGAEATEANRVVLRDYLNTKWAVY